MSGYNPRLLIGGRPGCRAEKTMIALILFWLSFGVVAYVYVGYPLLLWIVSRFATNVDSNDPEQWPRVTLIISAYNEEDVIAAKIENSLNLDYPSNRLEVLVVSDASDDDTDAIVSRFRDRGVKLLRMQDRSGKTLGLNAAVATTQCEIVVFSDANAMYRIDSLKALARRFGDSTVGAVVGESTYESGESDAERSEGLYWRYETWIKDMESRTGSVIGGDGAIYAIRRTLYEPMPADALSDFVNPLQVVRRGFKCVYERRALSIERAASDFGKEFRRKVRIVNRAWRAMIRMRGMLNPLTFGWFSVKLISHKLLRWWVPALLCVMLVANVLLWNEGTFYQILLFGQVAFYGLAAGGWTRRGRVRMPVVLYIPYYFCLMNLAGAIGIVDAYRGETYTTWTTARATR